MYFFGIYVIMGISHYLFYYIPYHISVSLIKLENIIILLKFFNVCPTWIISRIVLLGLIQKTLVISFFLIYFLLKLMIRKIADLL